MKSLKYFGFTLAEVLITLGIIGVVAAMTIPTLLHRLQAIKLRSQFLKSYSTLKQISKLMQADGLTGDANDYPPLSPSSFKFTFANYLKGATNCGIAGKDCYGEYLSTYYKPITGRKQFSGLRVGQEGSFLLPDGSIIFISNGYPVGTPISIAVDINGYKTPPDTAGYDLFYFQLMDDAEILPMGAENTGYTDQEKLCNYKSLAPYMANGIACAYNAATDPNYFKNLSWEFYKPK